ACQAALQVGEAARAEGYLAPLLAHYPAFAPGHLQDGLLRLARRRPEEAKAAFARALAADWRGDADGLHRTAYVWGEVCLRPGQPLEALNLAAGGLALWPRSPELRALHERAGQALRQ